MSLTKFTFTYEFESDLNGDDLKVEASMNTVDLDELLDRFQRFLVSAGYDVDMVQASFNNSELIPEELFGNDHDETVRKLESDLETAKMLYENERAMKLALKKELVDAGLFAKTERVSPWVESDDDFEPFEGEEVIIGGVKCKRLKGGSK